MKADGMMPLVVNLKGRRVVIFGGGKVGERKARLFARFGTDVVVVSREFTPALRRSRSIRTVTASIERKNIGRYLKDAFIAVPATNDSALNSAIAETARRRGILTNRVDAPEETDIIVPSVIRRGSLTIGISTAGRSPALSKFVRKRIQDAIGGEFSIMARIQHRLRKELKASVASQKERERIIREIAENRQVLALIERNKYEKALIMCEKLMRRGLDPNTERSRDAQMGEHRGAGTRRGKRGSIAS